MGQLVTTIVSIMVLLLVPLGVMQVHTVVQMENELSELNMSAVKYISNRGGRSNADVADAVRTFVAQELSSKAYRIDPQEIEVNIVRTKSHLASLWSHEDEYQLSLTMPYPAVTHLFADWQQKLQITKSGTINTMDYDL